MARSCSVEDQKAVEGGGAACVSPGEDGVTITCEDTSSNLVEKLHEDIVKNCNLLDPEHDVVRGRRSRSATPTPMDTILEDSGDKGKEKRQQEAEPNKERVDPPPEEPAESS